MTPRPPRRRQRRAVRARRGKAFVREVAPRDRFIPPEAKPARALRSNREPSRGGRK